jgi:uncharacterized membrane protein
VRYPSIDILRTIAIALMVQVHFLENLSGAIGVGPTGYAAPLFTFLSGVSYRLWVNSQEARGRKDADISKITIRRGLFLFGTGFLFNVLVWLPEDTFNWDILTFIGTAMLLLNVVRKMPTPIPLLICLLVFGLSPLFRGVSDYPAYWINGYFECDLNLSEVTLGFLVNGFFPIFPWIIFPVAGFTVASWIFPGSEQTPQTLSRLTIAGLCLLGVALLIVAAGFYSTTAVQSVWLKGWTMFPASTEYLLGTMGVALMSLSILHRWIDPLPFFAKDRLIGRIAATYSSHSFSIYLLHHVVHIWPLWIYGLTYGTEPTEFYQKAMPVAWSLPLAMVFLIACYPLFRWLDRTGSPTVESLMRWICD